MRSPLAIGRATRNALRTREILAVFVGYGFENVIHELKLSTLIQRGRNLVLPRDSTQKLDPTLARLPPQVRVRKALEDLGPTFVKLGQVLSLRPDLIPPEWADEFRKLTYSVNPAPFETIRARLEREFPNGKLDQRFASIDPVPIAAASMAQVHRARTTDGDEIVLKVLRPGIEDVLETDMSILRFLAEFAESHFQDLGYSPVQVVDQFSRQLQREVNLELEGRATDRFRKDFADNPNISFPAVYWKCTTSKVLALEEIKGILVSKLKPGDLAQEELRAAVAYGTDAVFRQCLEIGFFHADPHPGNMFILPGGRVCFIDCGMTGRIDPKTAGQLADLVQGVVAGDLDRVVEISLAIGDSDPALAEDRSIRADVWDFIANFENATLESLDVGALLSEFFEKIRRNNLRCPSDIVFLVKAITTIQSVGQRLEPEFDIVGHVRPYVHKLVKRRYGYKALKRRLTDSALAYSELVETFPRQVRSILVGLQRSKLTVNLEHRGLDRLTETIDRASVHIAHSVFIASLIMGSAILILADAAARDRGIMTIIAGIIFFVAVVLAGARMFYAWWKQP